MDCAEEVILLRSALKHYPGIRRLSFEVVTARMTVEVDGAGPTADEIVRAVERTGLGAHLWASPDIRHARFHRLPLALAGAVLLAAALVWQSAASGGLVETFLWHHHGGHDAPAGAVALYLAAAVTSLWPFLPRAWAAVRHLRPDMNVLVAISVAGAFWLGEWGEGATVAFLFAAANLLEAYSIARARSEVDRLLHASPELATVVHGGHEHRLPLERVAVGDIVRLKPGERILFDGVVASGEAWVDQSPLTGDTVLLEKKPGDSLTAGSINNGAAFDLRVTAPARDTVFSRILRMIEDSYHHRAPIDQWAERFARRYTPAMIALATAVAAVPPLFRGDWPYWFYQSMVLLLIACPCALVISTPVTIAAALASAAQRGVLIKGGAYLEMAARGPSPDLNIVTAGKASDADMERAHIVLMESAGTGMEFLQAHAGRALDVVKQNVAFALLAKIAFLVLAAFGLATLWIAVAADTGATLVVTLNGLRLLRPSVADTRK
jgi:Cd2+/Zn2+-exporting ATPase